MVDLTCDWKSGFLMDPSRKQRVGYLVHFKGLNMDDYLKQDITVYSPYNSTGNDYAEVGLDDSKKVTVVGVIESFSFNGGVGDPICISAYISSENAEMLQAKMKASFTTTVVKELAWWIAGFDEENKKWFEEAYPKDPAKISCQLNAQGGKDIRLSVAHEPSKVAPNIDVNVVQIYFEVVPAANSTFALHFATNAQTKYIRNWGLVIGTKSAAAVSNTT